MRIKKIKAILAASLLCSSFVSISALASSHWSLSDKTYVDNYHEGRLSDTYKGTVSVYGADWIVMNNKFGYPVYSRITYDVQGEVSKRQVNSKGPDDAVQRKSTIEVKDKWNFGSETKCYYSFGKSLRNTNLGPYTIEISE